jgi:serine/threonine protein kinase
MLTRLPSGLPVTVAAQYFRDLVRGLLYLHGRGVAVRAIRTRAAV